MNITPDLQASEPDLKDALQLFKKEVMLELHSHHIGVIEEFDALTQTATVRLAYKRTFFKNDSKGGLTPELLDYPLLGDVPCVFLGGGKGNLTFPIEPGDECILLINDRDIDRWWATSNSESGTDSLRLHALTDAIALVGVRSLQNVLTDFETDRAALNYGLEKRIFASDDASTLEHDNFKVIADDDYARLENGDTVVGVGGGKVKLENANRSLRQELQALIEQLKTLNGYLKDTMTAIKLITVSYVDSGSPATSGEPVNAASFTAISNNIQAVTNAIDTIKTNLGDLLE
jgi:hypothetical protein